MIIICAGMRTQAQNRSAAVVAAHAAAQQGQQSDLLVSRES